MARFRSPFSDAVVVAYGLARPTIVEPDAVIDVPEEFIENYEAGGWEQVSDFASTAAPAPAADTEQTAPAVEGSDS